MNSVKERVAKFMTLFRYILPELQVSPFYLMLHTVADLCKPYYRCNYFEEEEVNLHEWVTSWLQYMLSREMKFEDLVRLWGMC